MDILLAIALAPAIVLLAAVYRKDTVEPEPTNLIVRCLLFGCLATLISMFGEIALEGLIEGVPFDSDITYALVENILIVGVVEELSKYVFVMRMRREEAFNYTFDGIIYAVCVALGFAAFENVMYVLQYGLETGLVRAFTAVPMHCTCGVYMGYYIGLAYRDDKRGQQSAAKGKYLLAYIVPVLIHGFYDFAASVDYPGSVELLLLFIIVVYVFAIRRVNRSSTDDDAL